MAHARDPAAGRPARPRSWSPGARSPTRRHAADIAPLDGARRPHHGPEDRSQLLGGERARIAARRALEELALAMDVVAVGIRIAAPLHLERQGGTLLDERDEPRVDVVDAVAELLDVA